MQLGPSGAKDIVDSQSGGEGWCPSSKAIVCSILFCSKMFKIYFSYFSGLLSNVCTLANMLGLFVLKSRSSGSCEDGACR